MNAAGWIQHALPLYGLEGCSFTLLRSLGDAVARVETPDGPRSLRVNLPGDPERQLEVLRFQAQAHAAGLQVPLPLPNLYGRTVSRLPGRRTAVLSTWVQGEPAGQHLSPALAAAIGRVTARLHALDAVPDTWAGPRLDAAWLRGWWGTQAPLHLAPHELGRCRPAVEAAAAWLHIHERELQVIHTDLHFGNLLALEGGGVGVLDFGECAVAHPAFDLALTELEFMDFPDGPACVRAYRDAYQASAGRAYPLEARRQMAVCTDTAFLAWVYGSANEEVRVQKLKWVPGVLGRLAGERLDA